MMNNYLECPEEFGKRIAIEIVDKHWHIVEDVFTKLIEESKSEVVKNPSPYKIESTATNLFAPKVYQAKIIYK